MDKNRLVITKPAMIPPMIISFFLENLLGELIGLEVSKMS
jgi:hypothetical protein